MGLRQYRERRYGGGVHLREERSSFLSSAAARALGMPLDAFLIEVGKHGLYAIDYDLDDFRRELDRIEPQRS